VTTDEERAAALGRLCELSVRVSETAAELAALADAVAAYDKHKVERIVGIS
jgi:hypothetical protein